MFASFHLPIIDADSIAREVVEPGEEAHDGIVQTFGEEVLQADRQLNRKKLGQLVFSDPQKRKQLNQIVHPIIRQRMLEQRDEAVQNNVKGIILDIPLLFENNLTEEVQHTIVIYIPEAIQLERLIARDGLSEKEAKQRIASQISIEKKRQLADFVINNQGTRDQTFEQVKQLLQHFHLLATE